MSINWYDSDKITPVSFPLNLGAFSDGQSPNRKLWFYSDSSIKDLRMTIEGISDVSWKSFSIAKDFKSRPQAFQDYLNGLYWRSVPANTWVPIWIKFDTKGLAESEDLYAVNLRLTGELLG